VFCAAQLQNANLAQACFTTPTAAVNMQADDIDKRLIEGAWNKA
jgi:hypothetical protein